MSWKGCDQWDAADIEHMRGLDPRIHDEAQIKNSCGSDHLRRLMDCRVKPGHNVERIAAPHANP